MTILTNTKLRRKLLAYSFTHADEQYYVRELSGLIDEDPGNLSRELKRLEDEGLYTSMTKGSVKLYSLNKKYPLFKELKTIIFKTEGVEGSLNQIVRRCTGISLAFIYGSYAKNTEKKTSDIDLVVVGEVPNGEFARDIRDLEAKLNREINYTFYERGEFEKERKKEGGFLHLVLADKIILLKGELGA
jgi:predicted nucleotidyltransferase/predicted transcriptional regulator with HTH domain